MNNQKYLIAANWKQNGDSKSLIKLINDFIKLYKKIKPQCDILILPPSIYLNTILNRLNHHKVSRKKISLGSQNISSFENGAYTGELSVDMTKDYNCTYALIGHSERRHVFQEDEKTIAKKTQLSLESNMNTILCVGETITEYNKKLTKKVILRQLRSALIKSVALLKSNHNKIIIAYEPVWAIGTGENAFPEQVEEANKIIRSWIGNFYGGERADKVPILYGGSVNPENTEELIRTDGTDGFLIGGASLDMESFCSIVQQVDKNY